MAPALDVKDCSSISAEDATEIGEFFVRTVWKVFIFDLDWAASVVDILFLI